ncbi:MAG: polysaccharide deacetylase family protein [Candidatus Cloacimonetes bacterium]|nr:polysaccharide deacetylase family protein [Candidatus Cloacimonadota bacterium]
MIKIIACHKKYSLTLIILNLLFLYHSYSIFKFRVPVLLFHEVKPTATPQNQALLPKKLYNILKLIDEKGYSTMFPGDTVVFDEKKVILSFDDGTRDHFEVVMPMLNISKKQGLFFWVNQQVDALTSSQKEKLLRFSKNHRIGVHTNKHEALLTTTHSAKAIKNELMSSKHGLEGFFKYPINSFAFVKGIFDQGSAQIAQGIFDYNFTVEYDYFYPFDKGLHGRMIIFPETTLDEISRYMDSSRPHKELSFYTLCFLICFLNLMFFGLLVNKKEAA